MIGGLKKVDIFTNGACKGSLGLGGWGASLRFAPLKKEICGGQVDTTNNRMELTAAMVSLETLTESGVVNLTTDSEYVRKGVLEWIENCKKGIG